MCVFNRTHYFVHCNTQLIVIIKVALFYAISSSYSFFFLVFIANVKSVWNRNVIFFPMLINNLNQKGFIIQSREMCTCQWNNIRDTNLNCKFYLSLFVITIMPGKVSVVYFFILIIMWTEMDVEDCIHLTHFYEKLEVLFLSFLKCKNKF